MGNPSSDGSDGTCSQLVVSQSDRIDSLIGPLGFWKFPLINKLKSSIYTTQQEVNATEEQTVEKQSPVVKIDEDQIKLPDNAVTVDTLSESIPGKSNKEEMHTSKQLKEDPISALASGAVLPNQKIDNAYQSASVPNNGSAVDVLSIDIDAGEAAVIKDIANEWYDGTSLELRVDGVRIEKNVERSIASIDDPKEVQILARDRVVWRAVNEGSQNRDIAALADGVLIPSDAYDEKVDQYQEYMVEK